MHGVRVFMLNSIVCAGRAKQGQPDHDWHSSFTGFVLPLLVQGPSFPAKDGLTAPALAWATVLCWTPQTTAAGKEGKPHSFAGAAEEQKPP